MFVAVSAVEKAQKEKGNNPLSAGCLLQPPTPIYRGHNWPTLEVQKTTLEDLSAAQGGETEEAEYEETAEAAPAAATGDWDMDDGFEDAAAEEQKPSTSLIPSGDDLDFGDGDGDWDNDLDDLGDLGDVSARSAAEEMGLDVVEDTSGFQMPKAGRPAPAVWCNSSHAADHSAAGQAASSLQLLNRQIAASDFTLIQEALMGCYLGANISVPGIPGSGSMMMPLARNDERAPPGEKSLPRIFLQKSALVAGMYFSGLRA
jgi:coatomer subunit alpha